MFGFESIAIAIGEVAAYPEIARRRREQNEWEMEYFRLVAGISKPVYFQHCVYCTKAPDEGQKEARCTSCGAPLQEKEKVDRIL